MRLLQDGIKDGLIIPTEMTRKLTMDGVTKVYQVYKIKLSCLYYNEQNDRIATWISKYKDDNNLNKFDMTDLESYNQIIQEFIISSNPEAIEKTKNNINMVDQREPGVVLNDGRIIDGNRRFTCLRLLAAEDRHFEWFEAVILDKELEDNKKEIKMLELMIQHGEEGKVDYNPIDKLVGVYNDIIDRKLLTIAEYAKSTNETENEIKKRIELAEYMVEFLDYINAPKQFYIARELEMEGPLIELASIIKKCGDDTEKIQNIKLAVFNSIIMAPENNMKRFVHQMKSVIDTEYADEFIKEQLELAKQVEEIMPSDIKNTKEIKDVVNKKNDLKDKMSNSVDKAVTKVKRKETRNKPALMLEKGTVCIENIDVNVFNKLKEYDLYEMRGKVDNLIDRLNIIRNNINENLDS